MKLFNRFKIMIMIDIIYIFLKCSEKNLNNNEIKYINKFAIIISIYILFFINKFIKIFYSINILEMLIAKTLLQKK